MSNKIVEKYNMRIIRISIILFMLIVVLSFGIIKFTNLKNIRVVGLTRYDTESFLKILGDDGLNNNTLFFFLKNTFKKNDDIPFVDNYKVTLINGNSVRIDVYESDIVACVSVMESYFFFDKNGNVVASAAERPENVPCVTGFEFDEIRIFEKLKIQKNSLFETVSDIVKLLNKYGLKINEINFDEFYSVTLYSDNLTILIGKREEYDTVISGLYSVFEKASEIGGTLDMRYYSDENSTVILK